MEPKAIVSASLLVLSPQARFYHCSQDIRRTAVSDHTSYLLPPLQLNNHISFPSSSYVELSGSHKSSWKTSLRVNPWARLVLSPARQTQEKWVHFLGLGEFSYTDIFIHLAPSKSLYMHVTSTWIPTGCTKNFHKATGPAMSGQVHVPIDSVANAPSKNW